MYPAGTKDLPLGTLLAILVENESDIAAFNDFASDAAPVAPAAPVQAAAPTPAPVAAPVAAPAASVLAPAAAKPSGSRIFASPLAQNLANTSGVSLAGLQGTGPSGRIIKADVQEAIARGPAVSAVSATPVMASLPSAAFVDLTNSNIRKVIAERLTFSKQNIPHYYVTVQVSVDNLMKMREKLNKVSGTKLSVNDFVIKASAMASMKVPATNSSWMKDFIR